MNEGAGATSEISAEEQARLDELPGRWRYLDPNETEPVWWYISGRWFSRPARAVFGALDFGDWRTAYLVPDDDEARVFAMLCERMAEGMKP